MEWRFDKITRQTTKVDPSHLEFFRSEALDDPVSALVREDIQNRLDAKQKGNTNPVFVRYCLVNGNDSVDMTTASEYLAGLEPHLNSPGTLDELFSEKISLDVPMPFLVIEDFNTTGLKGDVLQTADSQNNAERNDFYWFIRNVGRTGKKAGDRGRWGLGKIVYPASSMIRSFFAYSVREKDHAHSLIGRSVFAIHEIEHCEYQSEGYFATFPEAEFPYFAVPETEASVVRRFAETFRIKRIQSEPGLSLVIPFPDESISYQSIISAVVHHYFWEILRGNLEVEVACAEESARLTSGSLADFVATWSKFTDQEKGVIKRRLEFCLRADKMKLGENGYFLLSKPKSYGTPRFNELFDSGDRLELAKRLFQEGQCVAVECPVTITKKRETGGKEASFLVYLQRDEELSRPDETFIRDGLTIIGESCIREQGVRALVLAEDPVITEFLGDAENPAHTKWLHTTKHFRGKYSPGQVLLDFVRYSAARLATLLGKVEDQMLEDLLEDVFSIPDEDQAQDTKKRKKRKKPKIDVKKRNRYISVQKLGSATGFSVIPDPDGTKAPDRIAIRMAYEVEAGNPFTAFHPADFDLTESTSTVNVKLVGCTESERTPNSLVVAVNSADFRVQVSGFDANRDLRIDARAEMLTAMEEDA